MMVAARCRSAAPPVPAAAIATAWGWVGLVARVDGLVYVGYPLDEEAHAWEHLYGRFGPLLGRVVGKDCPEYHGVLHD